MKRIISFVLLLCLLFTACAKEQKREEAETASYEINEKFATMSEDLYGFTAALNGTVLKFPMKYTDLIKLGWELKSNDKHVTLKSGQYSIYDIVKGEHETEAYFANLGDEELKLSECLVCGVSVAVTDGVALSLPNEITLGKSTKQDILSAFGDPTEKSENTLIYEKSPEEGAELILKEGVLFEAYLYNVVELEGKEFSAEPPKAVKEYKDPEGLSSDLSDFSFYLYGTTYTMPLPLSRLIEGGWMLAAKTSDSIPAGETLENAVKVTRSNRTLNLTLKNVADYPTSPENCLVVSIESTSDVKLDMTLANGCRVGSTKSNFEATFGRDNFTSIETEDKFSRYIYTDASHGTLTVTTNDETGYITAIKVSIE